MSDRTGLQAADATIVSEPPKEPQKLSSSPTAMLGKKIEMISWQRVRAISAEFAICRYAESRCNHAEIESRHAPLLAELLWGLSMNMLTQDEYDLFQARWQSTTR